MQIGRNDPCPCGSGKKFKKCCALDPEAQTKFQKKIPVLKYEEVAEILKQAHECVVRGDFLTAGQIAKEVLEQDPNNAQALYFCGLLMYHRGHYKSAANLLALSAEKNPKNAHAYYYLSMAYGKLFFNELALSSAKEAMRLDATNPWYASGLGAAYLVAGDFRNAAEAFRNAIKLNPDQLNQYANLAICLSRLQEYEELDKLNEDIMAKAPNNLYRLVFTTMRVPLLPSNKEHIVEIRQRLEREVDQLTKEPLEPVAFDSMNVTDFVRIPLFPLAYHGENDTKIMRKVYEMYSHHIPGLNYIAPHVAEYNPSKPKKKLRIGFISFYFWQHSVGRCYNQIIEGLAEYDDFEIHILTEQTVEDDFVSGLKEKSIHFTPLPRLIGEIHKIIASKALDILIYTDIGMNEETYCAAMAKLAPIQACWTGHPNTTGLKTIDYFISTRVMEPENAQQYYTETLLQLNSTAVLMKKPKDLTEAQVDLVELDFEEGSRIYACPMMLFKIHPEYDEVIEEILNRDDQAYFAFFRDFKNLVLGEKLIERLKGRLGEEKMKRVIFLPWLTLEQFYCFLEKIDAVLDSFPFGGGTTTYMILNLGIPMVTMRGQFFRGRITAGCYDLLAIKDAPIANNTKEFAELALKIANDKEYRESLKQQILDKKDILFDNYEVVPEFAELLRNMYSGNIASYQ